MTSAGDPKLSGVIWLAWGRECLTGNDTTSQTPAWHHQLHVAHTRTRPKQGPVCAWLYCVRLREPESVYGYKSGNGDEIRVRQRWQEMAGEWVQWLRMFSVNIRSVNNSDNEITLTCNQPVSLWALEDRLCCFGGNTTAKEDKQMWTPHKKYTHTLMVVLSNI